MSDLISRQAAISRAVTIPMFGRDIMVVGVSELENLPSAQPERKMGKWIRVIDGFECSNCECLVEEEREPLYDFYPSCGADMRGEIT